MSNSYPPPGGQQPPWDRQQPQYPQQQGPVPAWGGPPPSPPKKNRAGLIIGLGCGGVLAVGGLLVVIGLVAGGGSKDNSSGGAGKPTSAADVKENAPAAKEAPTAEAKKTKGADKQKTAKPADDGPNGDAKITKCVVEPTTTWPAADLTITNRSSKTSNYIVSVEFVDASGTRVGEGMAAANNVAPDQRVKQKAQSLDDTSGKITCKVLKVTRYASGS